jgi:hypothetical protein
LCEYNEQAATIRTPARDKTGYQHFLPADLNSPERLFAPGLGDVKAGLLEEGARSVVIGLL